MTGDELRDRLRGCRDTMSPHHATRLHRAVSWLRCAESHVDSDEDMSFVALWIAFNSCYAVDDERIDHRFHADFQEFAGKLIALDRDKRIYNTLWFNYSGFVRVLVNNHWVYGPFWQSQRNSDDQWREPFADSKKLANRALANNDVPLLLSIVMDRLYVLRNQIVHGGATWQSGVNRDQVRDGKRVLLELIPVIVEVMFDESEDWGAVHFPVVDR